MKEAIGHLDARLKELGSDSTSERVKGLEAQLAYAAGNPSQFVKTLLESSEPDSHLAAHLADGNLAAAEQQLPHTTPTARIHLMFYLVAVARNQPDIATRHLQAAVDLLAKGRSEDQIFARALKGDPEMPLDDVLRQHQSPHEKAILLTAVGLSNPAGREKCFALAQKLNYDKRFPYLLLKQVLASQPAN